MTQFCRLDVRKAIVKTYLEKYIDGNFDYVQSNIYDQILIKSLYETGTKQRNESIKNRDQRNLESEQSWKRNVPVIEWGNKNNPCPTCIINKKDHWDNVHYNCELHHTMSCDILLKFNKEFNERLKISNNEN